MRIVKEKNQCATREQQGTEIFRMVIMPTMDVRIIVQILKKILVDAILTSAGVGRSLHCLLHCLLTLVGIALELTMGQGYFPGVSPTQANGVYLAGTSLMCLQWSGLGPHSMGWGFGSSITARSTLPPSLGCPAHATAFPPPCSTLFSPV